MFSRFLMKPISHLNHLLPCVKWVSHSSASVPIERNAPVTIRTCEICVTLVHPCLVVACLHRLQDHPWSDKVVGADFLRLVASHQDPVVAFVRVFQDSDVSGPALFPFWRVGRRVPTVELRSDLKTQA